MFLKIFIVKCMFHLFSVKSVLAYEKVVYNSSSDATDYIFFLYYQGPTVNDYTKVSYEDGLSISEHPVFDVDKQTVFYLPGWGEKPSENIESVDTIASAFLSKNEVNLIVLDYSVLVKGDFVLEYVRAVGNITKIGNAFGYYLKQFIPQVQSMEKIHLVSHSLGSQIMSKTANAFGKGSLNWLTALDPAGPLFNIPLVDHLSKEDGIFVDIIHTDAWGFGDGRSIGHVDFYPNLGVRQQPYCTQNNHEGDFCSHHMSWRYYASSIRNKNIFPAKKCDLNLFCLQFGISWCCSGDAPIAYMGYDVNKTARGNFYLRTSASEPFGIGEDGFYV